MKLNKQIETFLLNTSILGDSSNFYICDNTKCYIKVENNKIHYLDDLLSKEIITYTNSIENYVIKNNIFINITNPEKNIAYKGLLIEKINSKYFLISTNIFYCFDKHHIEFSNITCKFLNRLLQDKERRKLILHSLQPYSIMTYTEFSV